MPENTLHHLSGTTTPGGRPLSPYLDKIRGLSQSNLSSSIRSSVAMPSAESAISSPSSSSDLGRNYFGTHNNPGAVTFSPPSRNGSGGKPEDIGQTIKSRVCDLCYLSLSLGADLYNPAAAYTQLHLDHPPQFGLMTGLAMSNPERLLQAKGRRSWPVSVRTSPTHSQTLSSEVVSSLNVQVAPQTHPSSGSSAASINGRLRQASAGTESFESADTHATTPPSGPSTHSSPKVAQSAYSKDRITSSPAILPTSMFASGQLLGPASASLSTEAAEHFHEVLRHPSTDSIGTVNSNQTAQNMRILHPLDPRNIRIESHKELGGSNPDSSLEAIIPSTPGVGWIWST
ncbi:MAG: hypothetical protein CYPHOPRED_000426 [Cyphobasidiales sp. Tagirdzhanova-0007]|nr:MAG: hypothetical protein CYPHOPRED_000426 [Cyphobasidiales sp. Tagirdzhanova-0007]